MEAQQQAEIAEFVAGQSAAQRVELANVKKLSGGAIQENWAVDFIIKKADGEQVLETVLRCDAPSGVSDSHTREQEFALLSEAFKVGVTVPEPLWLGTPELFGRSFFIMRRVSGSAAGHQIVKSAELGGDKQKLTEVIGEQMAKLHTIKLAQADSKTPDLNFLPQPEGSPIKQALLEFQDFLSTHHTPFPALEWGIRWLLVNEPELLETVLTHRDFRTGNYMVDAQGLTAVLDWEFAAWSDPREDLGWFCAKCWRFGRDDLAAGGIGLREDVLRGYERVSGIKIPAEDLHYWEVLAHVRWAIIAIRQGERHVSGNEPSLELALTAHIVPELEWEILKMTGMADQLVGEVV